MSNNVEKKIFHLTALMYAAALVFLSCSSAPKGQGDIYTLRDQAEAGLAAANHEASRGNFIYASNLLTESKRIAILTDDYSLIIRVCLSYGNVLFSLGQTQEAYAQWDHALSEAVKYSNAELLSLTKVHYARGNLLSAKADAASVLEEVVRESVNIRNANQYIAFTWQVRGLALRSLEMWNEAESAIRQSLDIHDRDRQLENASYDWYIIASIRSLSGNLQGAMQALESSIALDRRVENSWGLAASHRAMGDVLRKAGREDDALQAYRRSRDIYVAMGNDYEVREIDKRMELK